jgi:hypothetical protein
MKFIRNWIVPCMAPAAIMAGAFWLAGCGGGATTDTPAGGAAGTTTGGAAAGTESGEVSEVEAALAQLAPEDRALAEAQKVCPVGGELGSMGPPVLVMAGERKVFLCCAHCKEEFEANVEKYLAKLDGKTEQSETPPKVVEPEAPEGAADAPTTESGT